MKNIKLNKLSDKNIEGYNMDAREFIKFCVNKSKIFDNKENEFETNCYSISKDEELNFNKQEKNLKIDYFYMNLPKDAIEFLDVFKGLFVGCDTKIYNKNELPIVFVNCFSLESYGLNEIIDRIKKAMNFEEFSEKNILSVHNIKDVSPKKYMYCVSFKIPWEVAFNKNDN